MAPTMDASSWTIMLVGSISAALTTAAFVPQAVRVWRLRDARDISLPTFAIFSVGLVGWVVYGTEVASVPIIAANFVTLLIALAIVGLKLKFDRPGHAAPA
jgi:MtN3 and saliva related transmembrane protein